MKILVTGGAGYIGSHVSLALAGKGHDIVVADDLSAGHARAVLNGRLEKLDIGDADAIDQLFAAESFDAVMHFAGRIEVGESVKHPARFFRANTANSLVLIDAMVRHGVDKLIFSSTAAVYGEPDAVPIPESARIMPTNPYGASKALVEDALAQIPDIRHVCLRYFNAAGADPEARIGEAHDPETHLIPLVLEAALGKRESIKVFGTDYPTPDGTCIRDYIHVADLAKAHVMALEYLADGGASAAMNCGYGHGISVRQIIDAVARITSREFPVVEEDRRQGDPARLVADVSRITQTLGFKPEFDDIDAIVGHAWQWARKLHHA